MNQRFRLRPPLAGHALPFGQQIELLHNGQHIATARWHAPESADGVYQIADLHVVAEHQRQGHGSTLLKKCYAEAAAFFAANGIVPRRVWIMVEQKRHVTARAFLTRHGYQHVSTMTNLYRGQDGMIYQRTFD